MRIQKVHEAKYMSKVTQTCFRLSVCKPGCSSSGHDERPVLQLVVGPSPSPHFLLFLRGPNQGRSLPSLLGREAWENP